MQFNLDRVFDNCPTKTSSAKDIVISIKTVEDKVSSIQIIIIFIKEKPYVIIYCSFLSFIVPTRFGGHVHKYSRQLIEENEKSSTSHWSKVRLGQTTRSHEVNK